MKLVELTCKATSNQYQLGFRSLILPFVFCSEAWSYFPPVVITWRSQKGEREQESQEDILCLSHLYDANLNSNSYNTIWYPNTNAHQPPWTNIPCFASAAFQSSSFRQYILICLSLSLNGPKWVFLDNLIKNRLGFAEMSFGCDSCNSVNLT